MVSWRPLSSEEIRTLEHNHCHAQDWDLVKVGQEFNANNVQFTTFAGNVLIGSHSGKKLTIDGIEVLPGISHCTIKDCHIGDNVHISNVNAGIVNVHIFDEVIIQDVSLLHADSGAGFGQGVHVNVMNEAGGRTVLLCSDLNAQIAYLQAIPKHAKLFQKQLSFLMKHSSEKPDHGIIGPHARIRGCKSLKNILVGEYARLEGVSDLTDGTIKSCREHPTRIGADVIMKHFIVAEGAEIMDGALLEHAYVGQACKIGKQFSAEHSLFFANCEGFHSEANAIFAGPYTVTHHRSTLLIAAMFSFYNAGSGTNLSNHMYKLGPVHQGVFERGCKTGSSSYVLLESHIPAFSVVTGKHMSNINIPDFPFSHLAEENGKSMLIPGKNLFSVGTLRDGDKWPSRDRRKSNLKRDFIVFDVFSPYTVEKMRRAKKTLQTLYKETPKDQDTVAFGGIQIRRLLLRKGLKYYTLAVNRYLIGSVLDHLEQELMSNKDLKSVLESLECTPSLNNPGMWSDLAGLLAPSEKIHSLLDDIANEKIGSIQALNAVLEKIYQKYREDEWAFICYAFKQEYDLALHDLNAATLVSLVEKWEESASSLNALALADAGIEFGEFSKISYGLYQDRDNDFKSVRGTFEKHAVVEQLKQEAKAIKTRAEKLISSLKPLM